MIRACRGVNRVGLVMLYNVNTVAEDFVRALDRNGIPVTYLYYANEGHGVNIRENIFSCICVPDV
jgi:hypothetical protein